MFLSRLVSLERRDRRKSYPALDRRAIIGSVNNDRI